MDYNFYKIAHLIGISLLAIGVGGMLAGGEKRKTFVMVQGIGLLVMLVTGFGLLAKLAVPTLDCKGMKRSQAISCRVT
jgi:hypothetical protein